MLPIKVKETAKTCDNLVYVFENETYVLFEVQEEVGDREFRCIEINTERRIFSTTRSLDFGLVGVFKHRGLTTRSRRVREVDISGKVVQIENVLVTVPRNVLIER